MLPKEDEFLRSELRLPKEGRLGFCSAKKISFNTANLYPQHFQVAFSAKGYLKPYIRFSGSL